MPPRIVFYSILTISILLTSAFIQLTSSTAASSETKNSTTSDSSFTADDANEFREFTRREKEAFQKHAETVRAFHEEQEQTMGKNDAELTNTQNEFGEDEQDLEEKSKQMYNCKQNSNGQNFCYRLNDRHRIVPIEEIEHLEEGVSDDDPIFLDDDDNEEETLAQWDPVKVGFQRSFQIDGSWKTMTTKAMKPKVFEIEDFLTAEECDHIIALAKKDGLRGSGLHVDEYSKLSKKFTYSKAINALNDFNNWDLDRDGKVSVQEVKQMAENYVMLYMRDEDVTKMIGELKLTSLEDGYVTKEEFKSFNTGGVSDYMKDARENDPKYRDRYSTQAWLSGRVHQDPILRGVREKVIKITGLPRYIVEGGEPMQVVHYTPNGHYHAHFDGQDARTHPNSECCHFNLTDVHANPGRCKLCRFITIGYYLNDVEEGGETAFPVADKKGYNYTEFLERKQGDLYNLSEFCHNATLVVKPKRGKAVMWYNHDLDDNGWLGDLDYNSIHGGCDVVKGEKWFSNHWLTAPSADTKHKMSDYLKWNTDGTYKPK